MDSFVQNNMGTEKVWYFFNGTPNRIREMKINYETG